VRAPAFWTARLISEGIGRQPPGEPLDLVRSAGERGCAARKPPARRLGRGAQLGLGRGGLADKHGDQLLATAAALALEPRAGFGVALDRVGRERLDVGEDRLGEQAEHVGLDARLPGGGRQPPPRHARADAVCGLQRVKRAALAQLAGAERDVDLAPGATCAGRAPDQLDELAERLGHAGSHSASERSLQGARVVRHLECDRGEDLVRDGAELGLEHIRYLGGQGAPGLGVGCICHSADKNVSVSSPRVAYIHQPDTRILGI
jgi:hypothetical protein